MRNPVRNSYFDYLTAIRFLKLTTDAAVVKLSGCSRRRHQLLSPSSPRSYSQCKMKRPRSFLIDIHCPTWGQALPSVWSIPIKPGWRWGSCGDRGTSLAGGLNYEANFKEPQGGEESSAWTGGLFFLMSISDFGFYHFSLVISPFLRNLNYFSFQPSWILKQQFSEVF